jgi:lysophospholipase L1-like esterase
VGKGHAYPQLLETQWNAHSDHRPIEVINAGYPGNTSWTIRGELGDLLAAYRPDIVTIMLGVNDFFRQPMPDDGISLDTCVARAAVPGGSLERRHRTEWRLVRALWLLNSLMAVPPEQVWFGDPRSVRNDPAWPSNLVDNLKLIVACVQRAGAQAVLLTYPSSYYSYGVADDALRTVALDGGTPLIDLTQRFDPRCPRHKCDYLYGDQHPTAAGHAWIASIVVDSLAQAVPALGSTGQ